MICWSADETYCLIMKNKFTTLSETNVDIYTVDYSSAIKKKEIMPFVATWVGLEMIILSEESQTKTNIT